VVSLSADRQVKVLRLINSQTNPERKQYRLRLLYKQKGYDAAYQFDYEHSGGPLREDVEHRHNTHMLIIASYLAMIEWPVSARLPRWLPDMEAEPGNEIHNSWKNLLHSLRPGLSGEQRRALLQQDPGASLLALMICWYYDLDLPVPIWGSRRVIAEAVWSQYTNPNYVFDMGWINGDFNPLMRCFLFRQPGNPVGTDFMPACTYTYLEEAIQIRTELRQLFDFPYNGMTILGARDREMLDYTEFFLEWWYEDTIERCRKFSPYAHCPEGGRPMNPLNPRFEPYRPVVPGYAPQEGATSELECELEPVKIRYWIKSSLRPVTYNLRGQYKSVKLARQQQVLAKLRPRKIFHTRGLFPLDEGSQISEGSDTENQEPVIDLTQSSGEEGPPAEK